MFNKLRIVGKAKLINIKYNTEFTRFMKYSTILPDAGYLIITSYRYQYINK